MNKISKDIVQLFFTHGSPEIVMKLRVTQNNRRLVENHVIWKAIVMRKFPNATYQKHINRGDNWFQIYVILNIVDQLVVKLHIATNVAKYPKILGKNDIMMLIDADIIWPEIEAGFDLDYYECYPEWFDKLIYYYSPVMNTDRDQNRLRCRLRDLLRILLFEYNTRDRTYWLYPNNENIKFNADTTRFKWVKRYVPDNKTIVAKWQKIYTEKVKLKRLRYYVWDPV